MDEASLREMAMNNLPSQICPITRKPIRHPAVMHRDLSDWWPSNLHDMRDDRIANVMVVEHSARESYYQSLKRDSIHLGFSGGLDSTTSLYWCAKLFGEVHVMMFDYGQRHSIELDIAAAYISKHSDDIESRFDCKIVPHRVDMGVINDLAECSLTRSNMKPPADQSDDEMLSSIPNTFVPGRNIYFMTALAQNAYAFNSKHIAMGVNILDYSGYPDCRPEFLVKMRDALSIGIFNGDETTLGVHAPLMYLNKVNIIRIGSHLGVKYEDTHSCYNGVIGGCGTCDSCILRRRAFVELGYDDPSINKLDS